MATVTHYIYSHYDTKDREALEVATGQVPSGQPDLHIDESDDPWQTESSFGVNRRLANAPRFVPAVVSYDEINNMIGVPEHFFAPPVRQAPKSEVGSWYKSLARKGSISHSGASDNNVVPPTGHDPPDLTNTPPSEISSTKPPLDPTSKHHVRPDKNTWFIARALHSEPPPKPSSPALTLADILAREPPASSGQHAVKPPVFLALGPSNRGWSMLQQQGWSEGEGLGATVSRRSAYRSSISSLGASMRTTAKGKEVDRSLVKQEVREIQLDLDGDISEVKKVDVVDLTLDDSDDDNDKSTGGEESLAPSPDLLQLPTTSTPEDPVDSHSKPLLTPIPTILKSDRLGIGLKAKTVGPYKASKKRVTHNQAALAAHAREAEELRRLKALVGRGSRGFARMAKADSEQRRQLLASLHSS